jgi:hypothetical protein
METLLAPFRHPGKLQPGLPGSQTADAERISDGSAVLRERRQHPRGRIAGPHAATVLINEKNAALVADLSEGGMRVQALGRRLETGTTLHLQFQLPGSPEPIQISGVVAWVSGSSEAGIRFAEVSEALARRLREWLAKNEVLNAAREFMKIAGGWQAALDLIRELVRMLTGARGVAITMAPAAKSPASPKAQDEVPVRATVAAPIYKSERIVGHLEISSTELGAFDEQDLGLLPVLAAMVSAMLELRSAQSRKPTPKPPKPTAGIVSRIEGMFPTVRLRFVP